MSGGVAGAVRGLSGALLGCLIVLSAAAGELLQVSQHVIDRADHGAAARNGGEDGARDRAGVRVQVQRGEPKGRDLVLASDQVPYQERGEQRAGQVTSLHHYLPEPVKVPGGRLPVSARDRM